MRNLLFAINLFLFLLNLVFYIFRGKRWYSLFAVFISGITIIYCGYQNYYYSRYYPPADKLPHSNGMIRHPKFGDYPEIAPYTKGMTLYPGQRADVEIIIKPEDPILNQRKESQ